MLAARRLAGAAVGGARPPLPLPIARSISVALPEDTFALHRVGDEGFVPEARSEGLETVAQLIEANNGLSRHVAETSEEEMMATLRQMVTMRRMEITCDTEYKARSIRGFCHLYDGQEAVASGIGMAMDSDPDAEGTDPNRRLDALITSYRCHAIALTRGATVEKVFAELFGFHEGMTKGKGGSMHLYSKKHAFYGGAGIVGAQVPVGVGLAFANMHLAKDGELPAVSVSMYGDGAANQGQIWESANIASLWKLPAILCVENNRYGMGTITNRSSSNTDYYTMGNHIPGLRIDGMNVFAVREGMAFAKAFAQRYGPIYVEMSTYRYHGHSMSDPGTTYRDRSEIQDVRKTRDPIERLKGMIVDAGVATPDELKKVEKDVRAEVNQSLKQAKKGSPPDIAELFTEVYADEQGQNVYPEFIRMPNSANSFRA